MATAFQSSAFQSGGFQIQSQDAVVGGYTTIRRAADGIDRKKLREDKEFEERLIEAYDALHGKKVPEARAIIRRFVEAKPSRALPPASAVDFSALARDLEAAKSLLALARRVIEEDEEDYFMMVG